MRYDSAAARYRGVLAVELRMEGWTYDELAQLLGYTHRSAARKAVMRTIKERADVVVDAYRLQRYLESELVHRRSWSMALKGDAKALARCLRAAKERATLVGLT